MLSVLSIAQLMKLFEAEFIFMMKEHQGMDLACYGYVMD